MKKKLFIHIGMNKTGTSSIQSFFSENRKAFIDCGFLYPESGLINNAHYLISHVLGFDVPGLSAEDKLSIPSARDLRDLFLSEVNEKDPNAILISSEVFVKERPIAPVKRFFSDYDVKIIVGLRRHDDWWQSLYSQAVKTVESPPWGRTFEMFVDYQKKNNTNSRYKNLIERWADVFGKDRIIIFPFERQQNEAGLETCFFRALDFGELPKKLSISNERVNESPSRYALKLIDIFQRIDIESDVRKRLIRHAMSFKSMEKECVVSPKFRRLLIDENIEDYEYIAKEYLGRDEGKLFFSPLPDPDLLWKGSEEPTDDEISKVLVKELAVKNAAEVMDLIRWERLLEELKKASKFPRPALFINNIRDAAIALEDKNPQLSYELMSAASALRPKGIFLKKKLAEYEVKMRKIHS